MIRAWATWTSGGVAVNKPPLGPGRGSLGAWAAAPALSAIHPRARRPHVTARQLVQLASTLVTPGRDGLGLAFGSVSGCAGPDREFQSELDEKGAAFGSPSLFVYTLPTAAVAEIAIAVGATGPLLTVSEGLIAVRRAHEWVAFGRAERVLCGSYELGVTNEHIAMFLVEPGAFDTQATDTLALAACL